MKINLIGDILGGDLNYKIGWGIHSTYFAKNSNRKLRFNGLFKSSDITIGNLESPVAFHVPLGDSFRASIDFLTFLQKENVQVLSIANNHILDHGKEGYDETLRCLEELNYSYVGDYREYGSNYQIITKGDVKIGIFGLNDINTDKNRNDFAEFSFRNVANTIDKIRKEEVDLIILNIHWGKEYITFPSEEQRKIAKRIVDMGVDIIHGHHPHVIMPYEKYKHAYIFYSMGNFLMDMNWCARCRKGLKATMRLTKNKTVELHELTSCFFNDNELVIEDIPIDQLNLCNSLRKDASTLEYQNEQKRILGEQKIFSYLYLLRNFWKITKPTYRLLVAGILKKFSIK